MSTEAGTLEVTEVDVSLDKDILCESTNRAYCGTLDDHPADVRVRGLCPGCQDSSISNVCWSYYDVCMGATKLVCLSCRFESPPEDRIILVHTMRSR